MPVKCCFRCSCRKDVDTKSLDPVPWVRDVGLKCWVWALGSGLGINLGSLTGVGGIGRRPVNIRMDLSSRGRMRMFESVEAFWSFAAIYVRCTANEFIAGNNGCLDVQVGVSMANHRPAPRKTVRCDIQPGNEQQCIRLEVRPELLDRPSSPPAGVARLAVLARQV